MNWKRAEIQEHLHSDGDAWQAVLELAALWSARPGRTERHKWFGLLRCQYQVHLFINYRGDVGNGGHSQFFSNPVGAYANETLQALGEVGLTDCQTVLGEAMSVFPESQVPRQWKKRHKLINSMSPEVHQHWGRLDRRLFELEEKAWPVALQYLRRHEDEILAREGG